MSTSPESSPQIYNPPLELPSYGAGFLVHSYGEQHEHGEPELEDAYYVMWRFVHGSFSVTRAHTTDAPEYRITVFDPESDELRPLDEFADEAPLPEKYKLIPGRFLGINTIVEVQAYASGQPLNEPEYRYLDIGGKPDLEDKILLPEILAEHLPEYTAASHALVAQQLSKDFGNSPKIA